MNRFSANNINIVKTNTTTSSRKVELSVNNFVENLQTQNFQRPDVNRNSRTQSQQASKKVY